MSHRTTYPASSGWSILFPLNFFSPFGVYMNWLNPSRGESVFIFAEALPGEVLFAKRSPHPRAWLPPHTGVSAVVAEHTAGATLPLLTSLFVLGSRILVPVALFLKKRKRRQTQGRVRPSPSLLIFNPTQCFPRLVCLLSQSLTVLRGLRGRLGLVE